MIFFINLLFVYNFFSLFGPKHPKPHNANACISDSRSSSANVKVEVFWLNFEAISEPSRAIFIFGVV